MAHPCFDCGGECYCHGDLSDSVDGLTPDNCTGCDDCQAKDPHHSWEEDEEFDDDDDDAEALMNCGQMPGGGCSLVGTEYCDWDCPFSHELDESEP